MAKAKTLLDDVLAKADAGRSRPLTWFDKLSAEQQAELAAVKAQFNPAVHQKKAFALAVIEAARERGWEIGGETAVTRWLNRS